MREAQPFMRLRLRLRAVALLVAVSAAPCSIDVDIGGAMRSFAPPHGVNVSAAAVAFAATHGLTEGAGCADTECVAAQLVRACVGASVAAGTRGLVLDVEGVGEILVTRPTLAAAREALTFWGASDAAADAPELAVRIASLARDAPASVAWGAPEPDPMRPVPGCRGAFVDGCRRYVAMQRRQYDAGAATLVASNHRHHNFAPEYWGLLLRPVVTDPRLWRGKRALDVACGGGRNVLNLLRLAAWDRVDGCDLIARHVEGTAAAALADGWDSARVRAWQSAGASLAAADGSAPAPRDEYDFVMSAIAFQHICVHEVRRGILVDILQALVPGGLASIQYVFRDGPLVPGQHAAYFDNVFDAKGTNSAHDVRITDPADVIADLEDVGFVDVTVEVGAANLGATTIVSYPDQWLVVSARKPGDAAIAGREDALGRCMLTRGAPECLAREREPVPDA